METHTSNNPLPQLDDAMKRRLDDIARSKGVSRSDIIQEAVNEFVASHDAQTPMLDSDSIFDIAAEARASVPAEAWSQLPTDLAKNFDHYHYGHPREE